MAQNLRITVFFWPFALKEKQAKKDWKRRSKIAFDSLIAAVAALRHWNRIKSDEKKETVKTKTTEEEKEAEAEQFKTDKKVIIWQLLLLQMLCWKLMDEWDITLSRSFFWWWSLTGGGSGSSNHFKLTMSYFFFLFFFIIILSSYHHLLFALVVALNFMSDRSYIATTIAWQQQITEWIFKE